jgi:L-2,4-diaminobutyrate decarboxylase
MEYTSPDSHQPLDETLKAITEQVWEAVSQLPQLRPHVFNNDKSAFISREADKKDMIRFQGYAELGTQRPIEEVVEEARDIFSFIVRPNHPRFLSAIPSPSSHVSWLGEILTSAFNAWPAAWFTGSGISTIETKLIAWLAAQVGMPVSTGGTFVSGGSMANLSALAIARDRTLKDTERSRGVAYFSDQTHFSVPKVLRVLGLLKSQIRQIPADSKFRMDVALLQKTIIADKARGLIPFLIVANAGTTNTGSIDPLNEIADLAKEHKMWMHVDGSYGVSVALSKSYKSLLNGIEHCDSLAWDAHKWLFQTFGCAVVLVRDKIHLAQSFASSGEYFRDIPDDDEQPNMLNYGIELSRPARHMRLWFSMRVLGLDTMGRMIDQGLIIARFAETELRKLPCWEITSPAILGVMTFRYCPEGVAAITVDKVNAAISLDIIKSNIAYIQTTYIGGRVSLRICAIHPQMTKEDMREIIQTLHSVALRHSLEKNRQ